MAFPPPLSAALHLLMPMHIHLDDKARILQAGPTLAKLQPKVLTPGAPFFDLFEVQRRRHSQSLQNLISLQGIMLHLRLKQAPFTALKGTFAPLEHGGLLNLSFGISVLDAVRDFSLTASDFAPTDLTIEMLYLIEAKSAAMEASRRLNARLQGAMIAAEEQAFTDTLTGLKNRRAVDHVLNRITSTQTAYAVMHLDLDYFKAVNDTLGHAAGDHVLQHVARILIEETRKEDTVARFGGDEFVLIFRGAISKRQLRNVAARLITRLEQPILFEGSRCQISASIGISRSIDYPLPEIQKMLAAADEALYESKRNGRAQHRFHCASGGYKT